MSMEFLKGKWLGHPLHPALVHIPVGLWPTALVLDLFSYYGVGGNVLVRLAFYSILVGLLGALVAVPAGVADWSGIKQEKPAWKIGLYHMILNLVVSIIFAINLGLRVTTYRETAAVEAAPLILSLIGVIILAISSYLGGMMTYEHGIGVARLSKQKWRKVAEASHANVPPEKETP